MPTSFYLTALKPAKWARLTRSSIRSIRERLGLSDGYRKVCPIKSKLGGYLLTGPHDGLQVLLLLEGRTFWRRRQLHSGLQSTKIVIFGTQNLGTAQL